MTPDPDHTWLVECFAPGVDDEAVAAAAERVRAVTGSHGGVVAYLGALLMAEDEVVFHAFRAPDVRVVRDLSTAAGLQFERIVESVGVPAAGDLGHELTQRLIGGDSDSPGLGATDSQPRPASLPENERRNGAEAVTQQEGAIS